MSLEKVYQAALLADAAYVFLDADGVLAFDHDSGERQQILDGAFDIANPDVKDFSARGWTSEQFDEFQGRYSGNPGHPSFTC